MHSTSKRSKYFCNTRHLDHSLTNEILSSERYVFIRGLGMHGTEGKKYSPICASLGPGVPLRIIFEYVGGEKTSFQFARKASEEFFVDIREWRTEEGLERSVKFVRLETPIYGQSNIRRYINWWDG
jgi:hypothetical protein